MGGTDEAADAGVQSPAVAVMRTRFARCNSQADDTFMLKSGGEQAASPLTY